MIRKVNRTWFEVWGHEQAQNSVLKVLLLMAVCLCGIQSVALLVLSLRAPFLIAVDQAKTTVLSPADPSQVLRENEVQRVASNFVKVHHTWNDQNIGSQFELAGAYVSQSFLSDFAKANASQLKMAKDKKLSQMFFVSDCKVSWAHKSVKLQGHRLLQVGELTAATPVLLALKFELGPRSTANPEGVYFTSEEVAQKEKQ